LNVLEDLLCDGVAYSIQFSDSPVRDRRLKIVGERLERSGSIGVRSDFERVFALQLEQSRDRFEEFNSLFLGFHPIFAECLQFESL